MGRLNGKVAVITGAASGFGWASSLLFAKEGAKVVVADVADEGGEETVKMVKAAGGEATFVHTDVSQSADVKRMIKTAVDTYGRLDVLFNNAGLGACGALTADVPEDWWAKVFGVNITGVWLGVKYGIPEMLKTGGGSIVNTSSGGAVLITPNVSAEYSASKGAVITLTKQAAVDYASQGIRVNCICPGHCLTPMLENWLGGNKDAIKAINARPPMGRMGRPDEVAYCALFLASDESSYVTGEVLAVDGGYSISARGELLKF